MVSEYPRLADRQFETFWGQLFTPGHDPTHSLLLTWCEVSPHLPLPMNCCLRLEPAGLTSSRQERTHDRPNTDLWQGVWTEDQVFTRTVKYQNCWVWSWGELWSKPLWHCPWFQLVSKHENLASGYSWCCQESSDTTIIKLKMGILFIKTNKKIYQNRSGDLSFMNQFIRTQWP